MAQLQVKALTRHLLLTTALAATLMLDPQWRFIEIVPARRTLGRRPLRPLHR